ncbi:MAG TPA: redoxin domain-containing protein [Candidatus Acidoferrales bacterium]|jgi:thiol-disulfide isomerase/thioredoxin|nr:redoxin domain-containing protein [Candidatus Acidoferrales bacterium]
MRSPLPSLEGATTWLNGEPESATLRDKPVVVSFWSKSCYLCHESAGQVAQWRDKFAKAGVRFVAVHQPRSEDELDVDLVSKDAIAEMKLTQPVAIDNEHAIVDRFENHFVPAFYVFNRNHELRHFQAGGKGFERIEAAIERVLEEPAGAP